jgi:hypothetical protein
MTPHSTKLFESQTRLTQNAAILMYCCILHLPYEQHVKAQLSLTTAAIRTVRAGTPGYLVTVVSFTSRLPYPQTI